MSVKSSSGTPKKVAVLAACRLLAVQAVADGDEGGIGIELELDRAACTLGRILLCHRVTFRCVAGGGSASLREVDSDQRDFLISLSFSITTFAVGPEEAGFWPVIKWRSVTV